MLGFRVLWVRIEGVLARVRGNVDYAKKMDDLRLRVRPGFTLRVQVPSYHMLTQNLYQK